MSTLGALPVGRRRAAVLMLVLGLVVSLAGCTDDSDKEPDLPVADDVLQELATALSTMELTGAPFAVSTVSAATEATTIVAGMDEFLPTVTPGDVAYGEDKISAVGTLKYEWTLLSGVWAYETTVDLTYTEPNWRARWEPTVIHPDLTATDRLIHTRSSPRRAGIVGNGGRRLVDEVTVVHIGLDKMNTPVEQQEASARLLAERVGIEPEAYVAQVAESGEQAFVEAITFRQQDVPDILDIPGARGLRDTALLGPSRSFLQPVIGTVSQAWAEDVEGSDGVILPGEQVGHSGLQATFDEQLRGTPGDQVFRLGRDVEIPSTPAAETILYDQAAKDGEPLEVSFDLDLQTKAEAILAEVGQAAAGAIIRPSDGAILAAAISPESNGQPDATLNHYAPGSTFKIVTSLALLRQGYSSATPVQCSAEANAGGLIIRNYTGFPGAFIGSIPLITAVAQSCNTAFVNQVGKLSADDLTKAAGSLGAGIDYDAGGINYGTVPKADSTAMKGQQTIGQGGVLMSPVAMAGVIASVAAGKTVVPWMVSSLKPQSTAAPLTATEAAELQKMLTATVTNGLASNLQGVAVGGKSGTAEYGEGNPLPTHAWMVAYTDHDLAAAVWVHDGGGSGTAGPILARLLS